MAGPLLANRVKQTTTGTGTGTVNLDGGPATGFVSFVAGVGSGNSCYYEINDNGGNWEVGVGTVTTGSPPTLSRDSVISSSNAGSLVAFGVGTKDVFVTAPAVGGGLALGPATATSLNGNTITTGTGTLTLSTFTLTVAGAASISGTHTGTSSGTNTGDQTITLTGEATGSGTAGVAVTLTNASVIAKVLTGYTSGAGTVAATDSILQAIQKLNGNDATNANLTGPITSVGNATAIAAQTGTGSTFVVQTGPTLTGTSPLVLTQTVATSGSPTALTVTGGAHTTLAASTECIYANFNNSATIQFATGAYAGSMRSTLFQAPTYNTVGSSSWAGATLATVAISGVPLIGGNISGSPDRASLWVQGGRTRLDGDVYMGGGVGGVISFGDVTATGFKLLSFNLVTSPVISTRATGQYGWASGSGAGTNDTALCRNVAGIVEVNNGTAGTFAGLICGNPTTILAANTVQGIASRAAALTHYQTSAAGSLGNVSGGCIGDVFADVSTTHTDGTFDTLRTDTTVANALIVNGDKIFFDYTLTVVSGSTPTREFKLAFAGITIFDSTAQTYFATTVVVRICGYIIRKSSTAARATIRFEPSGSATILGYTTTNYVSDATLTGLTLTGTNALVLSAAAAGTGAASGDITLVQATVSIGGFGS